jgi:hypothetical protein
MSGFKLAQLTGLATSTLLCISADPTVLSRMAAWQTWVVGTFKPDGLRYDAVTNSLPVNACQLLHVLAAAGPRCCA